MPRFYVFCKRSGAENKDKENASRQETLFASIAQSPYVLINIHAKMALQKYLNNKTIRQRLLIF